jgi:hypothetical protein
MEVFFSSEPGAPKWHFEKSEKKLEQPNVYLNMLASELLLGG